jgi:hypothetical protein
MSGRLASIHKLSVPAIALIALAVLVSPTRASDADAFAKAIKDVGPCLVTVKYLLKVSAGGRDQDVEREVTGIMIDPKGLVLLSNFQLSDFIKFLSKPGGAVMEGRPTNFKVLVGADTSGVEAALIATDPVLDLAWLRITKPPEMPYAFLDFSKGQLPAVGQRLLVVRRLGKAFDRTVLVSDVSMGGIIHKPRELLVPSTIAPALLGLPVVSADGSGSAVGLIVVQVPESGENGQKATLDEGAGLILPAAEVVKATQRIEASGEGAATSPAGAGVPVPATQPSK